MTSHADTLFWHKVHKTRQCWLWTGSITPYGHGRVRFEGASTLAHRVAWIRTYGPILPGFIVAHRCRNRHCVRPSHLYLCTRAENNTDGNRRSRGTGRLQEWHKPRVSFEEQYGARDVTEGTPTKKCHACLRTLPFTMFSTVTAHKDGKSHLCRTCQSHYGRTYRKYGRRTPDHHKSLKTFQDYFWSSIEQCAHPFPCPDCCWLWKKAKSKKGYGVVRFQKKLQLTSRVMYALWNDTIIKEGHVICHTCDNPPCVNPAHLWEGTPSDNTKDSYRKGRRAHVRRNPVRGQQVFGAKMTPADITMIRLLATQGFGYPLLRTIFGLTNNPLFAIIHRKTWTHIT